MKIGIVCYPTFGGSGVLATELGIALADKEHEVHFITYQQPVRLINSFRPNIYFHEVTVPAYPLFDFPPYESALISTIVSVVQNYDLDVLHVHYAIPHASSAYFAQQILKDSGKNLPYITTLHGTDITLVGKDKTYEPIVTFSLNKSTAITAVSENLRLETLANFKIQNDVNVIYNFVDVHRFQKKERDHFKKMIAPNGERIITHVSNFRKVKRVDDVIKTFRLIHKEIPSKLIMIGDGPERAEMEDQVKHCCDVHDVRFLGKQEQVEDIFSISDLFLLPSAYESFGLAALEAMACQVPVISSNAGGLPEINIEGVTGYLSDVGNVEEMAQKAISILKDDVILAQFKERAFKHAHTFTIDKIVPQYESLYKKVIEEFNQN
ncbi:MAG TPA: N-acetyl-alpha-D-glucosaminyl L-malate synthase BshA [Edaphocola sp.]|nr:N-acetyl-alpha-D-glucosaminyl L-malate synthase BshA [Edaphocola sp.]